MFTGIVTDIGTVEAADRQGDLHVRVSTAYETAGIDLGASISCSGVCLTVVDKGVGAGGGGWVAFDVSGETIGRTAPGMWASGRKLNLERALRLGDELGGHIVTGHVDGIGTVKAIEEIGGSHHVVLLAGPELAPYVAPKGSITVDGVSLTVNAVRDTAEGVEFDLNIIPHTAAVTTFGALEAGQAVNLEIDVLARYLQRMEALRGKA
ncbi:riboflavin synthase [Nostoc ellipsosporum NOK]|uniref:riboflavin synthase n=1 Tax=Sphingomonas sp. IBVSS2 TaxID=1985172 RepID=UPI000A2EA5EC|nr:riboflavin synthase [Sphingomonas sp. IBVSS2]MDF2384527.1 riboflavin synthase [Nostoc ellipsosporum NOK]OSZ69704.1 riboflavin synthase [Sphingomonas sp. IBVSS2]